MYDPQILPQRLKDAREDRGWSGQQIADKLGVHVSTVNKWELGKNVPNADVVAKIANMLSLDISFFFSSDMTVDDAKLQNKNTMSAIEKMEARLQSIEGKIAHPSEDPLLERVRVNHELRNVVESIQALPGNVLREINALVFGYLGRSANMQKRDTA